MQFRVRPGIMFHDGTPLTAEAVVTSLSTANPTWNVSVEAESVVIEADSSESELLAELALPRNAIAKRNDKDKPAGTGPFRIEDWQPGKNLTLVADENCWRGRPFLDEIDIEMGRSFRDQMTALELGKANLVEVAPEQTHRISLEGRRLASSAPVELLALVFCRDAASPEEKMLRDALALSMERESMRTVLLQGAGQPAASILPNWMSGYAFVFSTEVDLAKARQLREQVTKVPTWTVGYDAGDPLDNLLAERIALNAKDAGLSLQPTSAMEPDLRLVRIPLASLDPWVALVQVAESVAVPIVKARTVKERNDKSGLIEDLYATELRLLATERIIPLFHLPVSYASPLALKNWTLGSDGRLELANAWLESPKP